MPQPAGREAGKPKITTIIASRNGAATLPAAIESFRAQTYEPKELIVIDCGSTDDTVPVLERYDSDISYWVSEPDSGLCDAWNKGLRKSTGEWTHFLGTDDYYFSEDVFLQFAKAVAHQADRSKIFYGKVHRIDPHGGTIDVVGRPWDPVFFRQVGMALPHQGAFHHQSLFEEYGEFDTTRGGFVTYEYLLRYLKDHDAVFLPDCTVAFMGVGGLSNHPRYHLAFMKEYRRAQVLHGTVGFNRKFAINVIKAAMQYALWCVLPGQTSFYVIDILRLLSAKPRMYTR